MRGFATASVEWEDMGVRLSKHAFALKVRGDSMEPKLPEGATIIVEPEESALHGRYVVVQRKDVHETTFKQLVQDGGWQYLKPLNPRYSIMEFPQVPRSSGSWCV
jgi:SOS-response transcriptional repressor LexA